jgi:hypothetical protein
MFIEPENETLAPSVRRAMSVFRALVSTDRLTWPS